MVVEVRRHVARVRAPKSHGRRPGGRVRVAGLDVLRDLAAGEEPYRDALRVPLVGEDAAALAVKVFAEGAGVGVEEATARVVAVLGRALGVCDLAREGLDAADCASAGRRRLERVWVLVHRASSAGVKCDGVVVCIVGSLDD